MLRQDEITTIVNAVAKEIDKTKKKYTGAEKMFYDPSSPYNGVPTDELERQLKENYAKQDAANALSQFTPEMRKAMAELLAPKDNTTSVQNDLRKDGYLDSYPLQ